VATVLPVVEPRIQCHYFPDTPRISSTPRKGIIFPLLTAVTEHIAVSHRHFLETFVQRATGLIITGQMNKQVYNKLQSTTLGAGRGESKPVPTFTDVTPDLKDNHTTACTYLLVTSRRKPTITAHDNISPEYSNPIESLKMST